ncbi:MAG: Gmad2 immunoglobulin-like domain-containing protein [Candidatus Pacebacteria bacterium]|nr:Gmad2 immunoglobulin-like domain-containing protein [Candidatus Paceibacterota bacterium]
MTKIGWTILLAILVCILAALAWIWFTTPAMPQTTPSTHTTSSTVSSTPATTTSNVPLDQQVSVSSPKQNASVSRTFTVTGTAPGGWFFEAVFPIQVRDSNDDLIGSTQGRAQGDWTQPGPIAFTATVSVDASYHGPAILILLKDNPSGNPENADEVTIPITIK